MSRRPRKRHVTRAVLFGPAVVSGPALWAGAGQVAGVAGLAVLSVLALSAVPVLLLAILSAPGALVSAAVPRRWRIGYRRAHGREGAKSAYISQRLRTIVFTADRYRCVVGVDCDGPLQVDHIRPWSQGGQTHLPNLMTLCRFHNVPIKSNYWPGVFYRGEDKAMAAAVLACERRARWNPVRWWRAAAAM